MIDFDIELMKLVPTIVGGIFIAWYWNYEKHKLERYRYLDESYRALLQRYMDMPKFGNIKLTERYRTSYKGKDALHYHYFAMNAHTVMETIFDQFDDAPPEQWNAIFQYHTALHSTWLKDNPGANRAAYVRHVTARRSKQRAGTQRSQKKWRATKNWG